MMLWGNYLAIDNHPADDATELYEREKDIALYEHARQELKEIDHALKAIVHDQYGKCEVCGKDIPVERLQAIPTTTFCVEHSSFYSRRHINDLFEGVCINATIRTV